MTTSAVLPPILDEIEEDIDDEVFTDLSYHTIDDEVTKYWNHTQFSLHVNTDWPLLPYYQVYL